MAVTTSSPGGPRTGKPLVLRALSKTFAGDGGGRAVLRDLDLCVAAGELVVILGPSGCGKTTCLRIVGGLEAPDPRPGTELLLGGEPIRGPGPDRGFVFQSYSSFPWLTVRENVLFGLQFCVPDRAERERRASAYLELVGLKAFASSYPRDLSGGQQQRVAIARTLATQPSLLLMDEPYAALDAQTREAQQTELLRIWRERRPTILFVTHDIAEAAFLAERVVIFGERGTGIVADVRTQPELEEKIARNARSLAAAGDRGRADALAALLGRPVDAATIEQRGPWIREQPEFYELTARLKGLLPAVRAG
ncbi:ABC transporter ATP-binding protein [Sorangium sp. So ce321]|uniref:ABC transporter ATP-binding protein n=1 Tax=Sorangium sp. So ce321 TaxID=3133300 RepID=UPI003F62563C